MYLRILLKQIQRIRIYNITSEWGLVKKCENFSTIFTCCRNRCYTGILHNKNSTQSECSAQRLSGNG